MQLTNCKLPALQKVVTDRPSWAFYANRCITLTITDLICESRRVGYVYLVLLGKFMSHSAIHNFIPPFDRGE